VVGRNRTLSVVVECLGCVSSSSVGVSMGLSVEIEGEIEGEGEGEVER
jgi:hypothetical protein